MEGTRHEKVAIVIASYVIGFVTAFIMYGNFTTNQTSDYTITGVSNPASVITANSAPQATEPAVTADVVTYTEGKLTVVQNEEEKLLSFNPDIANIKADLSELKQGYHFGDVFFKESNPSGFVFFCEQHEMNEDTCSGYVYDIAADIIYPVMKDGSAVTISLNSAKNTIWTTLGLKIGSNYSANPSAPWVLIDDESELDVR